MRNADLRTALEMVALSDPGMVREHNEDAVAIDNSMGMAILADGMGGYNAGEVASGMAIACISTELKLRMPGVELHKRDPESGRPQAHRLLLDAIANANREIFQTARNQPQCAGMGTTLVVTLFYDNRLSVAHIGDSRLYRLRDDRLEVLTRDHSLLQEQIDSGLLTEEQARHAHYRNLVTRALGIDDAVEADINDYEVEEGDLYLLCSDGLNDMLTDDEISEAMQMLGSNLPLASQQLVQMANDAGGKDNVSVILAQVKGSFKTRRSRFSWLLPWL
ncbi:Stp1/IreP family PP2C-type Ser/Thr phosphatase [Leeia sp.]|uniref:Stp1/IreP family PP2C-type Ser/Thr phosphatase n=1 Tax=Leeia sp. TaxID=2884678 RepID=UPI0035ADB9D5